MKAYSPLARLCVTIALLMAVFFTGTASADEPYLYPIHEDGLWGYMDGNGSVIIPAQYDAVELFRDGRAVVHTEDGDGLIDLSGTYLIAPQPGLIIEEYDCAYTVTDLECDAVGFYDKQSGFYLMPSPDYSLVMLWGDDGSGPIAVMNSEGLTGYLNRSDGSTAIPFRYTGESEYPAFCEGYALAANLMLMDEGEEWYEILPGDAYDEEDLWDALGVSCKFYLIDTEGIPVQFPEGIEPVSGVCGGVVVVSSELEDEELSEDSCFFAKYGIAKADGTVVMEPICIYDLQQMDSSGLLCFVANSDGFCGQMDAEGNVVIPAVYRVPTGGAMPSFTFENGYAVVEHYDDDRSTFSVLAQDGTVIAQLRPEGDDWYMQVSYVMNGQLLWVETWHVASSTVENGVWHVERDQDAFRLYAIRDGVLSLVSDMCFEKVTAGIDGIPTCTTDFAEGVQAVQMNGLWGFVDTSGDAVIPFTWQGAGSFDHGLAPVLYEGKLMYIGHDGAVVWTEEVCGE